MSWIAVAAAAVGTMMQIGSTFTEDKGTKTGLQVGGSLLSLAGGYGAGAGGAGAMFGGSGAGAGGAAGGGLMSSLPSWLGGGGEAGATIPGLLASSPLSEAVPSIASGMSSPMFGSLAPGAAPGGMSIAPGILSQVIGSESALSSIPSITSSMTSALAPSFAYQPSGAGITAPPTSAPPPAVASQFPWKDALAASAMTASASMRGQPQPTMQAPAPRLDSPGTPKIPQLGTQLPKGPGPLERYSMMLRRM